MTMRAVALNCTLKHAPEQSNTELLAQVVVDALAGDDVESSVIRVVDRNVLPGVLTHLLRDTDCREQVSVRVPDQDLA
jgi:hypothetical protein